MKENQFYHIKETIQAIINSPESNFSEEAILKLNEVSNQTLIHAQEYDELIQENESLKSKGIQKEADVNFNRAKILMDIVVNSLLKFLVEFLKNSS